MWRRVDSEHQFLEFKEAKLQFDTRKLSEYCVAIANEGGGHILLGVSDRPPRAVVGTQAFRDPIVTAERLLDVVGYNPGQPGVQPERFIDEYRARNEQLADFMRRFGICEEKGSGVDKVVHAAEQFRLPAPEFCVDSVRTTCILYGHRPFSEMSQADRVRACYQHCCLRYVTREPMTNQSLRQRFGLGDERAETASRILREASEAGLIKLKDPSSSSKKFARYVPYWA